MVEVLFPDPGLNDYMHAILGKPMVDPIYDWEINWITSMNMGNFGIKDLEGLRWCYSLHTLRLSNTYDPYNPYNEITSIEELKTLSRLSSLYAGGDLLSLSPISGQSAANEVMTLYGANAGYVIYDLGNVIDGTIKTKYAGQGGDGSPLPDGMSISPTSGAGWLCSAYSGQVKILYADWLACGGDIEYKATYDILPLPLSTLSISGSPISDLNPLIGSPLVDLSAGGCNISSLAALEDITSLQRLVVSANHISSLSHLHLLTNLTSLYAENNDITSTLGLIDIAANLNYLTLYSNRLVGITELMNLSEDITTIDLHDNLITNFSPLVHMSWLTSLDLSNNLIRKPTGISGMTSLKSLSLYNNRINDISNLTEAPALEELYLRNNLIEDVSFLSGIPSLVTLDLGENEIEDISSLYGLSSLVDLAVDSNHISNLEISNLTNLSTLFANNNFIDNVSSLEYLYKLTQVTLGGGPGETNTICDISSMYINPGFHGCLALNYLPLDSMSYYVYVPSIRSRPMTWVTTDGVPAPSTPPMPPAGYYELIASKDNMIEEWAPGFNYGAEQSLLIAAGYSEGDYYEGKVLLEFDLSSLPPDSTIKSALLRLYVPTGLFEYLEESSSGINIRVHELLRSNWEEGLGTFNESVSGPSNWEIYKSGSAWTTPGGDAGESIVESSAPERGYILWNVTGLASEALESGKLELLLDTISEEEEEEIVFTGFLSREFYNLPNRPTLILMLDLGTPADAILVGASASASGSGSIEGFLSVLNDTFIYQRLELSSQPVSSIFQALLEYSWAYKAGYLRLGSVDASLDKNLALTFQNKNLLACFQDVVKIVGGYLSCRHDPNNPTIRYIYLEELKANVGEEVSMGKNLVSLKKQTVYGSEFYTMLAPVGDGTGSNELNLSSLSIVDEAATFESQDGMSFLALFKLGSESAPFRSYLGWTGENDPLPEGMTIKVDEYEIPSEYCLQGRDSRYIKIPAVYYGPSMKYLVSYTHNYYLLSDTYDTFGEVQKVKKFSVSVAEDLLIAGVTDLTKSQYPTCSFSVGAADLSELTGREWDTMEVGHIVNVSDKGMAICVPVSLEKKKKSLLDYEAASITFSSKQVSLEDILSDQANRLAALETSASQGEAQDITFATIIEQGHIIAKKFKFTVPSGYFRCDRVGFSFSETDDGDLSWPSDHLTIDVYINDVKAFSLVDHVALVDITEYLIEPIIGTEQEIKFWNPHGSGSTNLHITVIAQAWRYSVPLF